MKPLPRMIFLITTIVLWTTCLIHAQQTDTISQLKEQIAKLEAVEQDSGTPPEVKSLNHDFLTKKRSQLHILLSKRIDALRQYQANVGSSLSADEVSTINDSIRKLEADLQKLQGNVQADSEQQSFAGQVVATDFVASARTPAKMLSDSNAVVVDSLPSNDVLRPRRSSVSNYTNLAPKTTPPGIEIVDPPKPLPTNGKSPYDLIVQVYDDAVNPNNNLKKMRIRIRNKDDESQDTWVNSDVTPDRSKGNKQTVSIPLSKGKNEITLYAGTKDDNMSPQDSYDYINCYGDNCGKGITSPSPSASPTQDTVVDRFSSLYTRGIVGLEQAGASSANSETKPFLDFFTDTPIWTRSPDEACFETRDGIKREIVHKPDACKNTYEQRAIYPVMSLWGYVRLSSTVRQISTPLATFAPTFLNPINDTGVNDLVKSFNFMVGIEKTLHAPEQSVGTQFLPTGTSGVTQKHSTYFIAGVGATNPLTSKATAQIFTKPSNADDLARLQNLFGVTIPASAQYIAFVSSDRDLFLRQYYAGIRVKTHYFKKNDDGAYSVINRPGAMFDLTIGQNEAITGGRLHGGVARFDGFYPLPVSDKSTFYLFGTAIVNLRRQAIESSPLILETAPSTVTLPNNNVFTITSPQANRDYYRIGFGVNLIELFNKKKDDSSKDSTNTSGK